MAETGSPAGYLTAQGSCHLALGASWDEGVILLHPSGCTWSEEKEGGTQVPLGGERRLESGQSVTAMAFLSLW